MSRPESVEDLTDWQRKGHHLATITAGSITRHPSLGQHLLAALAEADRLGLQVENDEIVIPLNEEELEKALRSAQRSWDYNQTAYTEAVADPSSAEGWRRSGINSWASEEGLPTVEWPADAEAVSA